MYTCISDWPGLGPESQSRYSGLGGPESQFPAMDDGCYQGTVGLKASLTLHLEVVSSSLNPSTI